MFRTKTHLPLPSPRVLRPGTSHMYAKDRAVRKLFGTTEYLRFSRNADVKFADVKTILLYIRTHKSRLRCKRRKTRPTLAPTTLYVKAVVFFLIIGYGVKINLIYTNCKSKTFSFVCIGRCDIVGFRKSSR